MTQKLKALTNHFKGSILAYTLIVLTIMLMTALSVASVTILDKKNAATTAGSTQAFANADSGSEILLGYRYRDDQQSLNTLATSRENGSCAGGVVTFGLSGGTATLTTYSDTEGTTPITDCTEKLATVQKVKSVGSFSGSSRAVEVAVAADPTCAWYQIDSDCGGRPCYGQTVSGYNLYDNIDNILNRATNNELCRVKHNGGWAVTATYDIAITPPVPPFWQRPVKYFDGASWVEVTIDGGYTIKSVYCCTVSCN